MYQLATNVVATDIDVAKVISALQHNIFGFPCSSTREDLSIDVSISYQCSTDIDVAKVISALQHRSKFNFKI